MGGGNSRFEQAEERVNEHEGKATALSGLPGRKEKGACGTPVSIAP